MTSSRIRISSLAPLPKGWRVGAPHLTSAFFDMLMSRWLDDQAIASNRVGPRHGALREGHHDAREEVGKLQYHFHGRMVLLFGESTAASGKYRVYIDGHVIEQKPPKVKTATTEFDPGDFARRANGNVHHVNVVATGLDARG